MFSWIKTLHVIGFVTWFAGLFYLPRLFVYHAKAYDTLSVERFKIMEQRLYYFIMAPAASLTITSGVALLYLSRLYYLHAPWMKIKLFCVILLIIFHLYCGQALKNFKQDSNKHSSIFYRWINEVPTVLLIAIVVLAEVKPF